jgi:copper chaperone CopZ
MSHSGAGAAGSSRVVLRVEGMGCRHAVRSVTARLRDVPGVETVIADAAAGVVTVTGTMTTADVLAAVDGSPCRARTAHAGAAGAAGAAAEPTGG